jgi:Bacterial protein of unknown function (DUF882)
MRFLPSFVAVALVLSSAVAGATPPDATTKPAKSAKAAKPARTARVVKTEPRVCNKPPVEIIAGGESATLSLTRCDGKPAPLAVEQLSVLARPGGAARPKITVEALSKVHGPEVAPGVRRIDPRLIERVEQAVDHFRKAGAPAKISIVSGYRPRSSGSYHQSGRALDLRIEGVTNEALVAFCKTLPDTGCGYYPNSLFVHMDVRDAGKGHVSWIDISHPGEAPKYVSSWPLAGAGADASKLPALPMDEQPSADSGPAKPMRQGRTLFF